MSLKETLLRQKDALVLWLQGHKKAFLAALLAIGLGIVGTLGWMIHSYQVEKAAAVAKAKADAAKKKPTPKKAPAPKRKQVEDQ